VGYSIAQAFVVYLGLWAQEAVFDFWGLLSATFSSSTKLVIPRIM